MMQVLTKAVEELGLDLSAAEEPTRSQLDEWFLLPGHSKQAPWQHPAPFFLEVHQELTKMWHAPYSA